MSAITQRHAQHGKPPRHALTCPDGVAAWLPGTEAAMRIAVTGLAPAGVVAVFLGLAVCLVIAFSMREKLA